MAPFGRERRVDRGLVVLLHRDEALHRIRADVTVDDVVVQAAEQDQAFWCRPCRSEMPLLQRTHDRIAKRDGTVLGVDSQEPAERGLEFLAAKGVTFPNLRDSDREYSRELGGSGYPETFLIDRRGRIAALRRGPVTARWLDQHLRPLLDEDA